ncbi:response regulator, partial [Flavobacterium johnsoniae]
MTQKLFKHILLADDDLDDCDFFSDVFKTNFPDVKLSVSNDGGAFLTLLEGPPNPKPDLIFLDFNIPVESEPKVLE